MDNENGQIVSDESAGEGARAAGLLAGMRIRKKLIVLHTAFSLVLAGILALALRPAIGEVVKRGEIHEAEVILQNLRPGAREAGGGPAGIEVLSGEAAAVRIDAETAARARAQAGTPLVMEEAGKPPRLVVFDRESGAFTSVSARLTGSRSAVLRLYVLLTLALLAVYALVAAALEIFVLPRQVYEPIQRLRDADRAVQEGRRDEELIAEGAMPADELGEIMRSRNRSIVTMRKQERELAAALSELGRAASDLKRKNHLLEMAQRNLAEADRLASLGMMSAGLSHEMNTPLAVLKGLAEKMVRGVAPTGAAPVGGTGTAISAEEAALMLRVVGRLERLSESLLDFARVRPARSVPVGLRGLVEEAWTLVRLDREAGRVAWDNGVEGSLVVECDPDRMLQVLVNLLRNSVDAMDGVRTTGGTDWSQSRQVGGTTNGRTDWSQSRQVGGTTTGRTDVSQSRPIGGTVIGGTVEVAAETTRRDGREWVSVSIADTGPGIDPEILGRLFEPFASTRLDSHGTGLGLAVAEGIVKEHGGVILARNRADGPGAVFEVMMPGRRENAEAAESAEAAEKNEDRTGLGLHDGSVM